MTRCGRLGAGAVLILTSCAPAAVTPSPPVAAPPEIDFAGVVTDVRIYGDHVEFTDADGDVHSVLDPEEYRDVGWSAWDGPLLILGRDAGGRFVAGFMTQDGLPADCYVQREPGIDRGAHIEISGILWRKAQSLRAGIGIGQLYPPGSRFCFDETGMIDHVVGR